MVKSLGFYLLSSRFKNGQDEIVFVYSFHFSGGTSQVILKPEEHTPLTLLAYAPKSMYQIHLSKNVYCMERMQKKKNEELNWEEIASGLMDLCRLEGQLVHQRF